MRVPGRWRGMQRQRGMHVQETEGKQMGTLCGRRRPGRKEGNSVFYSYRNKNFLY